MKNMKVPSQFQNEVREFLIFTAGTKDQQEELKKFLQMISPSLKTKVAIFIFANVVVKNRKFKAAFDNRYNEICKNSASKLRNIETNPQLRAEVNRQIVKLLVAKLSTQLNSPEDVIVEQEE